MKSRPQNIVYRVFTVLFAVFMLFGGYSELAMRPEGQEIIRNLGYPLHVMVVLGVAKILGALALLQPWFRTAKEWAYAGFTFNLLGACAARAAADDSTLLIVSPLLFLAWMLVSYVLWKKQLRPAAAEPEAGRYAAPLAVVSAAGQ